MRNELTVNIYGQQYRITGKASLEHMREVAQHVDETMRQVAGNNPRLDVTRLAVLSAVNIADDFLQLQKEHAQLLAEYKADPP